MGFITCGKCGRQYSATYGRCNWCEMDARTYQTKHHIRLGDFEYSWTIGGPNSSESEPKSQLSEEIDDIFAKADAIFDNAFGGTNAEYDDDDEYDEYDWDDDDEYDEDDWEEDDDYYDDDEYDDDEIDDSVEESRSRFRRERNNRSISDKSTRMRALFCEACGGNSLDREGKFLVCQYCGTKYTDESDKDSIVGKFEALQKQRSLEIQHMFKTARSYRASGEFLFAAKKYEEILISSPQSWEALYYSVALKPYKSTGEEISYTIISMVNCLPRVLKLIKKCVESAKQEKAVSEVVLHSIGLADKLNECSTRLYVSAYDLYRNSQYQNNNSMYSYNNQRTNAELIALRKASQEDRARQQKIVELLMDCANILESDFNLRKGVYRNLCIKCLEHVTQ